MHKIKIKKGTLESIVLAATNTFPNEFMALLGCKEKGIVSELVVLPALYGKTFASLRIDLIPFDRTIIGSVHSHPSHNNNPSEADLRVFKKLGKIHLIIAFPFDISNIQAFNSAGIAIEIEVVE